MEDSAGNRYLDMYNNVPGVGHCHPHITQAMVRQAGLLNTNTRYLFPVLEQYADSLLATFPAGLSNVIFTCTGSESNDIALRMARFISGRQGDHRHRECLSRQYNGGDGGLSLRAQRGPPAPVGAYHSRP
ncbi:aminotransferase class III-fold pyridoxal phosphate-dependent enzyme [Klebsiella variicola subsp. variicola]|nr:aminotransferase class III-fold pyridoxal phosphate-dependent enzyme [Klebsiella variicola subsp. variicola]